MLVTRRRSDEAIAIFYSVATPVARYKHLLAGSPRRGHID